MLVLWHRRNNLHRAGQESSVYKSISFTMDFKTNQDKIIHILGMVVSPIIILVGTIGNTLVIVVLSRKRMRTMRSAIFFISLAIADLMVLNIGLMRNVIRVFTGCEIRHLSEPGCKAHIFLVYFSRHFSSWILVAVAMERFLSVYFPFQMKRLCRQRHSVVTLIVITLCLVGVNAHFFWTFGASFHIGVGKTNWTWSPCTYKLNYISFHSKIWPWIEACTHTYVPFVLMLLCNILIINRLVQVRLRRRKTGSIMTNDRIASMTAMLLTATFTFLVLTTPSTLIHSGQFLWWKEDANDPNFYLIFAIAQHIAYLNSAINFFLYFVTSSQFRKELITLFKCKFTQNRVTSTE